MLTTALYMNTKTGNIKLGQTKVYENHIRVCLLHIKFMDEQERKLCIVLLQGLLKSMNQCVTTQ